MNLLNKGGLPAALHVNGIEIPINTDYRLGIQFELLTHGLKSSKKTRTIQQLLLYYGADIPEDVEAAYKALVWFISGGGEGNAGKGRKDDPPRILDYEGDAELLFAAFLDQYRANLNIADLHWWEFRSMVSGLREDHRISKIMGYRAMKVGGIKNKEYKKHVLEMKRLYAIKTKHSEEDLAEMSGRAFG